MSLSLIHNPDRWNEYSMRTIGRTEMLLNVDLAKLINLSLKTVQNMISEYRRSGGEIGEVIGGTTYFTANDGRWLLELKHGKWTNKQ